MGAHGNIADTHAAFYALLNNYGILTTELKDLLLSAAHYLTYTTKSQLLKATQVTTKIWFLHSGYVHWYKEEDGFQTTVWLSRPGTVILVPSSFLQQTPAGYYLQALTFCQALYLEYTQVALIMKEYPAFRTMITEIADEHTAEVQQYAEIMRLDKGEERMRYLQNLIGSDIYSLNVQVLSSFINMSESSFYKIRKNNMGSQ